METSLHRQLKQLYAGDGAQTEVRLDGFRIDAILAGELIEIQHGSLAAIRRKIARLVETHLVRVVKPLVAEKTIVRCASRGGRVVARRRSPKRESVLDIFHELIYFTEVFPHPRLVLEVPLVEVEETRFPGHGKRRRWRRGDQTVEDQRLIEVRQVHQFATTDDLLALLPARLPVPFHTGDLAARLSIARHHAQRIAYCLRRMGVFLEAGKRGNARLYELSRAG